ncbi:TVP38/TMEM64 family protein [Marinigracilibium pacificum]|uniref:TVP38/TMEM64 family membrane protein n=1 Tax=Marinigracilibium pacificum TaxID=2729599 RepID=A0A848J3J7_9BACT|nr:VTT domain-containing protein [Marinigracilibium pacificum]NMM49064.1 VTT domain-containing protein [Marinigracilibium pacificum]
MLGSNKFFHTLISTFWGAWQFIGPLICSSTLIGYLILNDITSLPVSLVDLIIYFLVSAIVMGLALMPTTLTAALWGFYLPWYTFPFLVAGYLLGALIGYYISLNIEDRWLYDFINKKHKRKRVFEKLRRRGFRTVVAVRLSPILPFAVMNFVMAAAGVHIKKFFYGSLVGMLPRTLLAYLTGASAASIYSIIESKKPLPVETAVWLILFLISTLWIGVMIRRAVKNA